MLTCNSGICLLSLSRRTAAVATAHRAAGEAATVQLFQFSFSSLACFKHNFPILHVQLFRKTAFFFKKIKNPQISIWSTAYSISTLISLAWVDKISPRNNHQHWCLSIDLFTAHCSSNYQANGSLPPYPRSPSSHDHRCRRRSLALQSRL